MWLAESAVIVQKTLSTLAVETGVSYVNVTCRVLCRNSAMWWVVKLLIAVLHGNDLQLIFTWSVEASELIYLCCPVNAKEFLVAWMFLFSFWC